MDKLIISSIDSRKNALFSNYKISDSKIINKVEEVFTKIEKLGEKCKDLTEFENKFQESSLNQEYSNLFVLVAQSNINIEAKQTIKERVKDDITAKSSPSAVKRNLKEKVAQEVRKTPVIGDILNIKQHIDLFNKFRRK